MYLKKLVCGQGEKHHNQLLEVFDSAALKGLILNIYQTAKREEKSIFYLHSPQDLVCSSDYIVRQGEMGQIKKGPGGPLHDFLAQKGAVLLVNYSTFEADDIVRLNALLNKTKRLADGSPVHESTRVLAVINPNAQGAYSGG
ncbi:MAG: hypothetical protein QNK11_00785 [Legionella sp.]|nr:hypothetical protein [Legionella sp.]